MAYHPAACLEGLMAETGVGCGDKDELVHPDGPILRCPGASSQFWLSFSHVTARKG